MLTNPQEMNKHAKQDSNLLPLPPEGNALSDELLAHLNIPRILTFRNKLLGFNLPIPIKLDISSARLSHFFRK